MSARHLAEMIVRIVAVTLLLLSPVIARAAGSSATVTVVDTQEEYSCTVVWTAAGDGTFTAKSLGVFYGKVDMVVTDPGATAPSDDYDITITDDLGCDVMGGSLADRDESTSEQAIPLVGTSYGPRAVSGTLTLNISNNAAADATGTVKIYLTRS